MKEIHPYQVLRRPIVTEKTTGLSNQGKYVFEVERRANKPQIKAAVELAFDVTVSEVNTMMVRGKQKRMGKSLGHTRNWKKAVVTLAPGNEIQLFEGI
jgi:large subunit ribosomal protein L23